MYTDIRLVPVVYGIKGNPARVSLAIGGGAAPAESPVSVWNGTAWVALPGPPA